MSTCFSVSQVGCRWGAGGVPQVGCHRWGAGGLQVGCCRWGAVLLVGPGKGSLLAALLVKLQPLGSSPFCPVATSRAPRVPVMKGNGGILLSIA